MGYGNEQRAGCCAGHPLNFKLAARHAFLPRGHSPAVQTHSHARTQTLVHRARLSVRESGAPWHLPPLISRPVCTPLGPSRKTQTKQGE